MAAFSRQHYETIAAAIKHQVDGWADEDGEATAVEALRDLAASFVATFHMDSPDRFDEVRFMTACGFPPPQEGEG